MRNIWERRLRLLSGLFLALYVVQHLINHALGIVSFDAMEGWRSWWAPLWDFQPVKILLYSSFIIHICLAYRKLYQRRSLRLPRWELFQLASGLAIFPLLIGHVVGTRFAAEIGGLDPDYYFVVTAQIVNPRYLWQMPLLVLILWVHTLLGLHFWLRLYKWYRQSFPVWVMLAITLPVLSLAGFLRAVLTATEWARSEEALADIFYELFELPEATFNLIMDLEGRALTVGGLLLLLTLLAREIRGYLERRSSEFQISHSNGQTVMARKGQTLLEAIRMAGVRHASVCGGKGRCTTCRVRVGEGLETLAEPESVEQQALSRIGADANIRLACQLKPNANLSVTPLVNVFDQPGEALNTRGGVQGKEREVVCMFVDMRGSTRMGEKILPFDVVFVLNQFFTELSNALDDTNGHYSQFTGDGLMALYGLQAPSPRHAARDALQGAVKMYQRLDRLNQRLKQEFGQVVKMGVGIHCGPAIVGHMGPPTSPVLTAIGDCVNTAARLESLTKPEGCDVVVSVDVLRQAQLDFDQSSIKVLEVRGRVNGIEAGAWDIGTIADLIQA